MSAPERGSAEALRAVRAYAAGSVKINSLANVRDFFRVLSAALSWHPDSDFADYIHQSGPEAGEDIFSEAEAVALNTAMQRCFGLVTGDNRDLYAMALESAQAAGWAPAGTPPKETQP